MISYYTTIIATSSIICISFGSLYGGEFIKYGRRSTIINFNIVALVASLSMFTLNFKIMCVGRLLFGFACGVMLCATPKMIDETVPAKLIDKGFGASTAILMCFFQFIVLLMAMGNPESSAELAKSYYWMCILGL